MKKLTVATGFIVLLCIHAGLVIANPKKKLIEVKAFSSGFVADSGERLYLRIYEDGEVNFESRVTAEGSFSYKVVSDRLSETEMQRVRNAIAPFAGLEMKRNEIAPLSKALDHEIVLEVVVRKYEGEFKKVRIVNFFPAHDNAGKHYPKEILSMLRCFEKVRSKSNLQFFSAPADWAGCDK